MDWASLILPPGMSPVTFAALLGSSFAGSFITAAFGIGGGAVLLAIMASLMPGSALIPVHGVVQLGSNAGRMAMMLRHVAWRAIVPWFLLGTMIGAVLGGAIVVELPGRVVQAGVGLFIIYSVLARPPDWLHRWPLLTGAIASFLTMFFGATGLFVAGYTKSLKLDRFGHVATHAAMMTLQHLLKVLVFGFLGFAYSEWAGVIVAMILVGLAGTWSGRLLLGRLTDVGFRRALDAVLILISLRLVWVGFLGGD